jgi:hypothetical protein
MIVSWSLSRAPIDVFALLRTKCATYSGPNGSLSVLQGVSNADDFFVMAFVKRTNVNVLLCFRRSKETGRNVNGASAASPKTSTLVPRLFVRCIGVISVFVKVTN